MNSSSDVGECKLVGVATGMRHMSQVPWLGLR